MDLRDLVRDALDRVNQRAHAQQLPTTFYRFGDASVAIRVDGNGATLRLLDTIRARHSPETANVARLDIVGGALDSLDLLLPSPATRHRTVLRANADLYYLWLNEAGGYLTVVDRRTERGLVWFTAPDRIASWHVARPVLHALKGFSLNWPWVPIHAASVARHGRAILVVGASGAGKTSIALSCALAGWQYLGDDAVMVRADRGQVAGLYASARLRADMFDRFPRAMAASLAISEDAGELKAEIDMTLLGCLADGVADVAAIVLPRRTGSPCLRLEPAGRSRTLHGLMAAIAQSMLGDEATAFEKLTRLVEQVPAYDLDAGNDPVALTDALVALAEGGAAT